MQSTVTLDIIATYVMLGSAKNQMDVEWSLHYNIFMRVKDMKEIFSNIVCHQSYSPFTEAMLSNQITMALDGSSDQHS